MNNLVWVCKDFKLLTSEELYLILQLRSAVFVVEQNCVFLDADGKDADCQHLMGFYNNQLVAYTRLVPNNIAYKEVSIGRVATALEFRNFGFGKQLMQQSIDTCYQLFGKQTIKIGAQLYLKKFYEGFGFLKSSEVYLEDDIEHIHMVLNAKE